jgi:hypothetical protein
MDGEGEGKGLPTTNPAEEPWDVTVATRPLLASMVPARVMLLLKAIASISSWSIFPWAAVRAWLVEVLVKVSLSWTTPGARVVAAETLTVGVVAGPVTRIGELPLTEATGGVPLFILVTRP